MVIICARVFALKLHITYHCLSSYCTRAPYSGQDEALNLKPEDLKSPAVPEIPAQALSPAKFPQTTTRAPALSYQNMTMNPANDRFSFPKQTKSRISISGFKV